MTVGESPEDANQLPLPDEHDVLIEELRCELLEHLGALGLGGEPNNSTDRRPTKESIRSAHAVHREDATRKDAHILFKHGRPLLQQFAAGCEIDVGRIDPELVPVEADTEEAMLFRLGTLLWSVPVSRGFGRRMRFLVRDRSNKKLIGLLALGSPVFNLSDRDMWIGWTVRGREERLINVMDAFVIGAVPPYSQLIGGKLVATLLGSREVSDHFDKRYGMRQSIISGRVRNAHFALATTTSALGHSSLYNRLKIPGLIEFHRLGMTAGWGHFHVSDALFGKMRRLLELENHKYFAGHSYGNGPNWRLRVVRQSLQILGLPEDALRHGIRREIYGIPLATNWREYLQGEDDQAVLDRPTTKELADACIARWMLPRSQRRTEYLTWTREETWAMLCRGQGQLNSVGAHGWRSTQPSS